MIPTVARVNVPFRWSIADGLQGQSMIARSYGREIAAVISRPSRKWVPDRNGLLVPYNAGSVAVGMFNGEPAALFEAAATNLVRHSDDFTNAVWVSDAVAVTPNLKTAPDGTATMDYLAFTTLFANSLSQTVTFTGNGEKSVLIYLSTVDAAQSVVGIRDVTAGVNRHTVLITWTNGVPTLQTNDGAGTLFAVQALANGTYAIAFSATGVIAANTNNLVIQPCVSGVGSAIYAWRAGAFNSPVPSSPIQTEGSSVTRSADSCYFDVPSLNPPRTMTVYLRSYNVGGYINQTNAARVLHIGDSNTGTDPRFSLARAAGSVNVQALYDDGVTLSTSNVTPSPAVALGTLVEHRGVLDSNFDAIVGCSVSGGTESVGAVSASGSASAWANTRIYLAGLADSGNVAITHVVIAEGVKTMAEMRELAGV